MNFGANFRGVAGGIRKKRVTIRKSGERTLQHIKSFFLGGWVPLNSWYNDTLEFGAQIVLRAVEAPLRQMALNAGNKPDVMLEKALSLDEGFGFNISTGDVADLISEGIIDPAKVSHLLISF